jgi:hypothetical protein
MNKKCPICLIEKSDEEYHKYFSKSRQKYRTSNYCKPCSRDVSNVNAKKNYQENKEKKLLYAKDYREKNKEKIKSDRLKYRRKKIDELQNCYVKELLTLKSKIPKDFIEENPQIIETRRLQIKIKRKLKTLKNGKK